MNKLLDYGRKAWFIVKVMTGYEERRIRAYRLQLQDKIQRAQAKKKEIEKAPDQVILSEVRRMVEEMQNLNKQLDETEARIEEYFKPLDKNVHMIMNMHMEKEEKQMKERMRMMQNMQREAAMRTFEAEQNKSVNDPFDPAQENQEQKK
ncbi:hypothetical protein LUZ60_004225 [Juncus effusus]|nr:hypothetical protein LUZ60_004225 [Juncus effusus]